MSGPTKQGGGPVGTPSRTDDTSRRFWIGYAVALVLIDGLILYAWWPK